MTCLIRTSRNGPARRDRKTPIVPQIPLARQREVPTLEIRRGNLLANRPRRK